MPAEALDPEPYVCKLDVCESRRHETALHKTRFEPRHGYEQNPEAYA